MAITGTKRTYPAFRDFMDNNGMDVPGTNIAVSKVDKFLGNKLPKNPSCSDCTSQNLARLTYLGKYRDEGLVVGRYTGKNGNVIRTYDQTYNHSFVMGYTSKATNAIVRAQKLNNSTPLVDMQHKTINSKHFDVAIKALSKVK